MMSIDDVRVERVRTPEHHALALRVVDEVYVQEKGWMERPSLDNFPPGSNVSWFLATFHGEPAGLMRVLYDPPLNVPPICDAPSPPDVDWKAVAARARIAEIGRLMIAEGFRNRSKVVVKLMGASTREAVGRRYTHLLTDVFEGDPRSPFEFHTKVLGFEKIGTHRHDEMKANPARTLLLLDIERAYRRLGERGGRFFREFTDGYLDLLEGRYGPLMPLERAVS